VTSLALATLVAIVAALPGIALARWRRESLVLGACLSLGAHGIAVSYLPALAGLLGGHVAGHDQRAREARRMLEAFGALVGASRRDGDVTRTRVVATLAG